MAIGDMTAYYLRESDPRAAAPDKYGIPVQRQKCDTFAADHGYVKVAEYVDAGEDSAELYRPALTRMRRDMEAGRFQVILVARSDRLARDPQLQGFLFVEAVQEHGVRIEFADPDEQYDNSPEGDFMRNARAYFNAKERQLIRQKTQDARRARARAGKLIPGRSPAYGYVWADDKKTAWCENPDTAHTLRRLYTGVLRDGLSLKRLAEMLTTEHVRLPSGTYGVWRPSNIRRILRNPAYIGQYDAYHTLYEARRRVLPDGTPRTTRVPRERPLDDPARVTMPPGTVPALVDPETWLGVQRILDQNKLDNPRRNSDPDATLLRGGLVVCGYCGRTMHAVLHRPGKRVDGTRKEAYWTYVCDVSAGEVCPGGIQRIHAHVLDRAIWQTFTAALMDSDRLAAQYEGWRADREAESGRAEADVQQFAKQMRKLNDDIDRLNRRIEGEEDDEIYATLRGRLRQRLDERKGLEQLQQAAQEEYRRQADGAERLAGFRAYAAAAQALLDWPELPTSERRNLLLGFDAKVAVWHKGHQPRWALLLGWQNALLTLLVAHQPVQFGFYAPELPAAGAEGIMDLLDPAMTRALRWATQLHPGRRNASEVTLAALKAPTAPTPPMPTADEATENHSSR